MNHRQKLTLEDVKRAQLMFDALALLDGVDGETLENVIALLGMTEQMTRQLVLTAPTKDLEFLIEERMAGSLQ